MMLQQCQMVMAACIKLVIVNNGLTTQHLSEGQIIGCLQPVDVTVVDPKEEAPDGVIGFMDSSCSLAGTPQSAMDKRKREQQVSVVLNLDPRLTSEEQGRLKNLLHQYADIFALESSELESTNPVKHIRPYLLWS